MTLKSVVSAFAARPANWALTLLRNHQDLRLSREEFRYSHISFSQFGEDLSVIRWIDEHYPDTVPVYVDAGCYNPIHHSNTLLLHKRGWRGVNVDMGEARIAEFNKLRPDDVNVVAALSSDRAPMLRLEYDDTGLTDRLALGNKASVIGDAPIRAVPVETQTLNEILLGAGVTRVGYLNIDCEGHDLEVLKGFDIARYAPAIVTIEAMPEEQAATQKALGGAGYQFRELLHRTMLFTAAA